MASSTFLSTSFSSKSPLPGRGTEPTGRDLSLAIRAYVMSNPSHSTSLGATEPGDRMLSNELKVSERFQRKKQAEDNCSAGARKLLTTKWYAEYIGELLELALLQAQALVNDVPCNS